MRRAWSSRRVLLPGSGTDQREAVGPAPGSGFDFGFSLGPHRTDRFRPALKNAYWGASVLCEAAGMEWRRRDRRKFSLTMEDPPGLPVRSCGGFPGIGRTLPSRHFPFMVWSEPPDSEAQSTSGSLPPGPRQGQPRPRRPAQTPPVFGTPMPSGVVGGCSNG